MPALLDVIRHICLSFPQAEEVPSRGSPDFRVNNKTFATYVMNHHGDGRLALWLPASVETQQMYVNAAPDIFFVPPYVGPKGWFGVDLSKGLAWNRVADLLLDSYCTIAPAELANIAEVPSHIPEPDSVDLVDIDPLYSAKNQSLLTALRQLCTELPEVVESDQFGSPCFKAGKKTFCVFTVKEDYTAVCIWVGAESQLTLTADKRFHVPAYIGHNGWINLNISEKADWGEIRQLVSESYRHFALKRMLKTLDGIS